MDFILLLHPQMREVGDPASFESQLIPGHRAVNSTLEEGNNYTKRARGGERKKEITAISLRSSVYVHQ